MSIFRFTTKAPRHKGTKKNQKKILRFVSLCLCGSFSLEFTTKAQRHKEKQKKRKNLLCGFVSRWFASIHHKGTKAQRKAKEKKKSSLWLGVSVVRLALNSPQRHQGTKKNQKKILRFVAWCLCGSFSLEFTTKAQRHKGTKKNQKKILRFVAWCLCGSFSLEFTTKAQRKIRKNSSLCGLVSLWLGQGFIYHVSY